MCSSHRIVVHGHVLTKLFIQEIQSWHLQSVTTEPLVKLNTCVGVTLHPKTVAVFCTFGQFQEYYVKIRMSKNNENGNGLHN